MTNKMRIIAGVAAVAILAVWYLALWRPANKHLAAAHATLASAQQDEQLAALQQAAVRAKVHKLPAEVALAQQLQSAVPSSADLGSIIEEINGVAAAAGVTWQSESQSIGAATAAGAATPATSASSTTKAAGLQTVQLSISVSGTTAQLLSFVKLLTSAPQVMQVAGLNVPLSASSTAAPSTQAPGAVATGPGATSIAATLFVDSSPLPKVPKVPSGASH